MNVLPLLERQTDRNFIHLNRVNVTNFTWKSRARIKKSRIDINNIWVLFLFNATTNSDLLNPHILTELGPHLNNEQRSDDEDINP